MLKLTTKVHPVGFPPVSKTLPQAVKKIAETLKPEKIILFGSYAYGNPTPDSDVDLLVIMNTTAKQTERYLAVSRVLSPRQFPVDIIVKTPAEIKYALSNKENFFIREIILRGKMLYERRKRS
jgi:predicted nucleotidyltransferase